MPQTTTARTVLGSTTQGSAGSAVGASLDLGATNPDTTLRLDLAVTAMSGTSPSLVVAIETSTDNTNWRTVKAFAPIVAVGKLEARVFAPVDRYVRASWTLTGTTPSATFSVSGVSLRPITHLGDIGRLQWPTAAFVNTSDEKKEAALATAELEATNQLTASKYVPPFTSWDDSLRQDVANIAAWNLLSAVGFNPESGPDSVVRTRFEDSKKNLKNAHYVNLVDSTPDEDEGGGYVVSSAARNWS